MEYLPLIIAVLFLLPGLAAVFVPVLPAVPYLFVVTLIYALLTGFHPLSGSELAILGVIALVALAVDQLSGILGAKYGGATKKALLFGFIGTIVGAVVGGGPIGAFAGLFGAILVAELTQLRTHQEALKAATGGLLGVLVGYTINIVLAFTFFILFLVFALRG